jgi:hypothetical protein
MELFLIIIIITIITTMGMEDHGTHRFLAFTSRSMLPLSGI